MQISKFFLPVQIDPAQYILVFKYPSRNRVNINNDNQNQLLKRKLWLSNRFLRHPPLPFLPLPPGKGNKLECIDKTGSKKLPTTDGLGKHPWALNRPPFPFPLGEMTSWVRSRVQVQIRSMGKSILKWSKGRKVVLPEYYGRPNIE